MRPGAFVIYVITVRTNRLKKDMTTVGENAKKTSGKIELIIGPMFSGKTTELLRRIRHATRAWCRVPTQEQGDTL